MTGNPTGRGWLKQQLAIVGLAAAALSFESLIHFARNQGVPNDVLAFAFPLCLDGLILVSVQSALSPGYPLSTRVAGWFFVIPPLAGTIMGNLLYRPHAPLLAVVPPVSFLLTAILAALMSRPPKPPKPEKRKPPKPKVKVSHSPPPPKTETPQKPQNKSEQSTGNKTAQIRALVAKGYAEDEHVPIKQIMEKVGCSKNLAQRESKRWRDEHEKKLEAV